MDVQHGGRSAIRRRSSVLALFMRHRRLHLAVVHELAQQSKRESHLEIFCGWDGGGILRTGASGVITLRSLFPAVSRVVVYGH